MIENTFIGLHVHAVNMAGCELFPETGEILRATMASDPAAVLAWPRCFRPPVKAVYGSGPSGYILARFLRSAVHGLSLKAGLAVAQRVPGMNARIGRPPGLDPLNRIRRTRAFRAPSLWARQPLSLWP